MSAALLGSSIYGHYGNGAQDYNLKGKQTENTASGNLGK